MYLINGITYTEIGKIERTFVENSTSELKDFKINFTACSSRFVKVIATNLKENPKGVKIWLFIDEILIN